jgi:O-antigen ligase
MVLNFENIINQDTPIYPTESTAIRWKIWEKSFDLITDSLVLGYGTGDANDQLMKAYNEEAYLLRHIIEKKYNAHNTFFQLWIMIGFTGPLIILSLLLSILIRHHYSFFSIAVVFIFMINFSLESMLERHAGVMIFTFFVSLIIVCKDSPFFLNKQLH